MICGLGNLIFPHILILLSNFTILKSMTQSHSKLPKMASVLDISTNAVSPAQILHRFTQLSSNQKRAVSSVVGASVADAATRPTHWLYNRSKLESIINDKDPAFWHENLSPFYSIPTGRRSCYNDISYTMLLSLPTATAHLDGFKFDPDLFMKSLEEFFKAPSEYYEAFIRREKAYDPSMRLEDRKPVPGPWQQGAVTHFLSKRAAGEEVDGRPESKETDGLCAALPLIARLSLTAIPGKEFEADIISAARVVASNQFAMKHVLASARILRAIINQGDSALSPTVLRSLTLNSDEPETDSDLLAEWNEVMNAFDNDEPFSEAAARFGAACAYPGSFMGPMLALARSSPSVETSKRLSYADAIRRVIMVGGCNCSKANFVGACLGAAYGIEIDSDKGLGIPIEWIDKTDKGWEIFAMALERVA